MIFVNKIFFLVLFECLSNIFAQDVLQNQFDLALKLFNRERYFDSITEFKRLQFFDDQNKYGFTTNYYIGLAYKRGGKFDDALKYFTLAEIKSKSDDEFFLAKIYQARTNILRRTTNQAQKILDQLENDKRFALNENEIGYWRGWAFIFADDWERAFETFSKDNLDTSLANLCRSTFNKMYSVDFAKYSSYLIPGAGQIYTGEYLSGILSLGWNILFGYLTINSFVEDRIFDGFIVGNFLWLRFYTGNIQNSEKFARQKNLVITNKALNFLQNSFKGPKP